MVSFRGLCAVTILTCSVWANVFDTAKANVLEPRDTCAPRLKQPLPAGVLCGKAGSVKKRTQLYPDKTTPTLQRCQSLCLNDPKCLLFSYNSTSHLCGRSKDPYQGFMANQASKMTFWNRKCFTTTCPTCPENSDACSTATCHDLSSDNKHCGVCNNPCKAQLGLTCQEFECRCSDGITSEPYLQDDSNNCGKCGNECRLDLGLQCDNGVCTCGDGTTEADLNSSFDNCGACGNFCLADKNLMCIKGSCACANGATEDQLEDDDNNCGACGNKCGPDSYCYRGGCS